MVMSRLIDADKLLNKIDAYMCGSQDVMFVKELIKEQPTAFDVDKVIEKLKHSQYMLLEEVNNATSYSHEEELIENIRHYEYAINIVKAGGV